MFLTSVIVLFLCSFGQRIHCESTIETVSVSVNQSCSPFETQCAFGCCPYEDGVCCIDGYECCQHGQTCIPIIGICIGAVDNNDEVYLTASKPKSVRGSVSQCPAGMSDCGEDRCCIYPGGECCSDGEHCCPPGFRCDVPGQRCVPDGSNKIERNIYSTDDLDKPLAKLSKKTSYKTCPGGNRMCPSSMSCCVDDNGEWGCCPNPPTPNIRKENGNCCYQLVTGYTCCPDELPVCTFFGCMV